MIWIALHLPLLSLETFAALGDGGAAAPPLALLQGHRIVSVDAAARLLGIEPGMKRGSALALAPQLRLGQVDLERDAEALQAVAHAALGFTPSVSIALPCGALKGGGPRRGAGDGDADRWDADRWGADRSDADRSDADRRGVAGRGVQKRGVEKEGLEKEGLEKEGVQRDVEKRRAEKRGAEKRGAEKRGAEKRGVAQRDAENEGAAKVGTLQTGAADTAGADTVLLEVRSSLRYFGGLAALRERLRVALAPLGHRLHTVVAPTALGAALLARIHPELQCDDLPRLRAALEQAPLWLLGPGRAHWEVLQGMGLRTIADLRALPRAGLAQRFGEALLDEVDRAFGHRPDVREPLALPPVFESRLELFARADTTEQVLQGARLLLARLVAWLSAQHAQARRFTLMMAHEPRWRASQTPVATPLDVALAEPSRDAVHLLALLSERLAQVELPAPTLELRLHCADIARRPPPTTELFPTPRAEREGLTRLIERLQARLGPDQVQRLREVQDHRPERATETRTAEARRPRRSQRVGSAAVALQALAPRPVWLLTDVQPLQERGFGPCLDGQALRLLSGPERIECGWWDGALAERDYYVAEAPDGALVWIYRSRVLLSVEAEGWFLQGRFG